MSYTKHANPCVYETGAVSFDSMAASGGAVSPHPITDAVVSAVVKAAHAVQTAMTERTTVKQLSALEDHILADIGVHRSQIREVARKMTETPGLDHRTVTQ